LKVRVRNFQSIEDQSVEIEGLTVVTGPSNRGKSALIRALAAVFLGRPGDDYIRHGKKETGVRIEEDGDFQIIWRKTTKPTPRRPSVLKVNGALHTKFGRDHDTLTKEVGVSYVETGRSKTIPQIARQHDPPFLVMSSETEAAELLKMMARADQVGRAQDKAGRDRRGVTALQKVREEDYQNAVEALVELDWTVEVRESLEDAKQFVYVREQEVIRLQSQEDKIAELRLIQPVDVPEIPTLDIVPLFLLSLVKETLEVAPKEIPSLPDLPSLRTVVLMRAVREIDEQCKDIAEEREFKEKELGIWLMRKREMEVELEKCPACGRTFEAALA